MNLVSVGILGDLALSGFFVTEGKQNLIVKDISQAVAEMYACAKHLRYGVTRVTSEHRLPKPHRQNIFRGALTNGLEWIFIILYLIDDGHGATYKHSTPLKIGFESLPFGPESVEEPAPDVIAGILSYWVSSIPSIIPKLVK